MSERLSTFTRPAQTTTRDAEKRRETLRRADFRWRYGLTNQQYDDLMASSCSICGKRENLSVDHDHKCCTGARSCGKCIRGMLCAFCNAGLGNFRDNPELLRQAITYLESRNKDGNPS